MPNENIEPVFAGDRRPLSRTKAFLILGAVLIVGFGGFTYWYSSFSRVDTEKVISAIRAADLGDYERAIAEAEAILQRNDNDPQATRARGVIEVSNYFSGDSSGAIKAVQLAKEEYIRFEGNAVMQAHAINRLIGYARSSTDPKVTQEVFKGDPFASLVVQNDYDLSLKNLAEKSVSLFETSAGLFAVGTWHARQILRDANGNTELSAQELNEHVAAIRDYLARADSLYPNERAAQEHYSLGILYEPSFFFSEAFLYGALAMTDTKYLANSESSAERVISHFKNTVDENGNTFPILQPRLPYTYLNNALFINEVDGARRDADVTKNLDALLEIVGPETDIHDKLFVAYIASLSNMSASGLLPTQKRMARLAALHPVFKAFLEHNGWKF